MSLGGEHRPLAEVTLSYRHRSKVRLDTCDKRAQYEPTYQGMMDRCYWDYVRVYAPSGSTLLTVEGADEQLVADQEKGKTVFAAYFVLAPGEHRQITFRYLLPTNILVQVDPESVNYELLVQKQPGTLSLPLQLRIEVWPGMKVVHAKPTPTEVGHEVVQHTTKLQLDRRFELILRAAD
ncbi:MAG: hypothetical protein ABIK79_00045 [Chloroflexota bacterium]